MGAHDQFIEPVRIVDIDGNSAAVRQFGGVWRLAVEAIVTGGVFVIDTDDDLIEPDQVLPLGIVENYGYEESAAKWRRFEMSRCGAQAINDDMRALCTKAFASGIDSSRPFFTRGVAVDARMVGVCPVDETWYGLYVNSFVRGLNSNAAIGSRGVSVEAWGVTSVSGSLAESRYSLLVNQSRESGLAAALRGRRFYTSNQTPGTLTTGQTSFVNTTPTLMLRLNTANVRAVIRSLDICLANTPGGLVYVLVALDTIDRYSAAGTAIAQQNTNEDSSNSANSLFYENPIANAPGTVRYFGPWIIPPVPGSMLPLYFEDGIILGPTDSTLLVYVWAPTTAPQFTYALDHEEVA
jgi:hypothetical protein